jgi:adenylate cyclase
MMILSAPPSADDIRRELAQVLNSDEIAGSRQLTSFLKYIVAESLAGRSDNIKERNIAIGALNRGADFDPRFDCIVRVVAGKLRRALVRYYAAEGAAHALRIDVPKGAYRPVFRPAKVAASIKESVPIDGRTTRLPHHGIAGRPVIAILPFVTYTRGPEERFLADSLGQDVSVHLSKFSWLDVTDYLATRALCRRNPQPDLATTLHAEFALAGTVRRRDRRVRITAQLSSVHDHQIIWAEQFDLNANPDQLDSHDVIVHRIVATLGDTMGVLAQIIRGKTGLSGVEHISAIEAVLKSLEFASHLSPVAYEAALHTARRAVKEQADFALAWANLGARRLDSVGGFISSDDSKAAEEALFCLKRAMDIEPTCTYALWNMSLYHLYQGNLEKTVQWAERAMGAQCRSPFDMAGIACALSGAGELDRGDSLIQDALAMNPRLPGSIHWAATYNNLCRGDAERALVSTESFSLPQCYWDPLLRSAAHLSLGETAEAAAAAREAIMLRPELAERPRDLVGKIIHNPTVQELMLESLQTAGMPG